MSVTSVEFLTFKTLLNKFVDIIYLKDLEAERMYSFIFSGEADLGESNDPSEIYETMKFFRDIVVELNYKTLEELNRFFEDQELRVLKTLEPLTTHPDTEFSTLEIYKLCSHSFKTDAIKTLLREDSIQILTYDQLIHNMYQNVHIDESVIKFKNPNSQFDRYTYCFKRLKDYYEMAVLYRKEYYKHFIAGFSGTQARRGPWMFDMLNNLLSWFTHFHNNSTILSKFKKWNKQRQKIKSTFRLIFDKIEREEPLDANYMKGRLIKIMLLSKLHNHKFKSEFLSALSCGHSHHTSFPHLSCGARKLYQSFGEKKWSILKSPEGRGWTTTDNPGFSIDVDVLGCSEIKANPNWNNVSADSMIYFPLSKDYCIRLQPLDSQGVRIEDYNTNIISFETSSEKEFALINKLALTAKPKMILSQEKGIQHIPSLIE